MDANLKVETLYQIHKRQQGATWSVLNEYSPRAILLSWSNLCLCAGHTCTRVLSHIKVSAWCCSCASRSFLRAGNTPTAERLHQGVSDCRSIPDVGCQPCTIMEQHETGAHALTHGRRSTTYFHHLLQFQWEWKVGAKAKSDGTGHLELELILVLLSPLFLRLSSQFRAGEINWLLVAAVKSNEY